MIFKKIRTNIIFVVVLGMLSLAICLVGFYTIRLRDEMKQTSIGELQKLVNEYAMKIDQEIIQKETFSEDLRNFVEISFDINEMKENSNYVKEYKEMLVPYIRQFAEMYYDAWIVFNPELNNQPHDIWFLDIDKDNILERVDEISSSYYDNQENKDWFFVPKNEGEAVWIDPYQTTVLSDKTIKWVTYSTPIIKDSYFLGVAGTDFLFQDLETEISEINPYETGYGFLLNSDFDFILHPYFAKGTNFEVINKGQYLWVAEYMKQHETGVVEYKWIDGSEKILAYDKLHNGWYIGFTAQKSEIFKEVPQQLILITLMTIVFLLVTLIFIYLVITKLTGALEKLTYKINLISEGNYEIPISIEFLNYHNEVGVLANAVEEMRKRQKVSFDELVEYANEMELKVADKTKELLDINAELNTSLETLNETQETLMQNQRLEAISKLIIELSHRMNTPLGNAKLALSFLKDRLEYYGRESNLQTFNLEKNHEIMTELLDITNMSYSGISLSVEIMNGLHKLSLDTTPYGKSKINLSDHLKNTLAYLQGIYKNSYELKWTVYCSRDIEVEVSAELLSEAISHLITHTLNLKTDQNIDIFVSLNESDFWIDYFDYFNYSQFVDDQTKNKVFDPFFFTPFSTGVTGLELHLTYNIIKLKMGGNIAYLKNDDNESYFRITLPLIRK